MKLLDDHEWPESKMQHLWGPWMPRDSQTQYRQCVHPNCSAVEDRKVKY